MKKNRNIVVLICSIIMVLGVLAGCSSQNASTGSNANTGAQLQQTAPAQSLPDVPSTTIEVEPIQADQPASQESTAAENVAFTEAVSDNPNIIDGIDFTEYLEGGKKPLRYYFINEMHYDSLRWVGMYLEGEHENPIIGIFKNGDSIKWKAENAFKLMLYAPKKVVYYEKISEFKDYPVELDDAERKGFFADTFFEKAYDNEEMTVRFTYEDGTTEDITVYITAE